MSASKSASAAQLEQLIEQAKAVRPVPPAARTRVLKRAQSSVLAPSMLLAAGETAPVRGSRRRAWFVAAAGAPLFAAAAAMALHASNDSTASSRASLASGAPVVTSAPLSPASTASSSVPELAATPPAPSAAPPVVKQQHAPESSVKESYAAELELLRRAHAAYGNGDFANALRLLATHARRFPNGRLAEEREALRVRALGGSGQSDSARRAAHAFADRFPRSVLLSRTMSAADAGPQ